MIRYNKKFNSYLNQVVRNFNAKITRLEKQGYSNLPNKESVRNLKNSFDERRYLKTKLNELKRFSRRGSENLITTNKGITFTKWEYQNLQIMRRVQLARYKRELKKYQTTRITNFGKLEIPTESEYESDRYLTAKSRYEQIKGRNLQDLSLTELEKYKTLLSKRKNKKASRVLKNNLIEAIDKSGLFYGQDEDDIEELIHLLDDKDEDEILELFESDTSFKDIFDYYKILKMKSGITPSDVKNDVDNYFNSLLDMLR